MCGFLHIAFTRYGAPPKKVILSVFFEKVDTLLPLQY